MTACKYWDCGWCYAPDYLKTNAVQGGCFEPEYCPSQMFDLKFTSSNGETTIKVQDTGRLGTVAPKTQLHIRKTPMTELEELKAQLKIIEKKVALLEEIEKTPIPKMELLKDGSVYCVEYNNKKYYCMRYRHGNEWVKWWRENDDCTQLTRVDDPETFRLLEQMFAADISANPQGSLKFTFGPTLYDVVEDWWSDVFCASSTDDMETSIKDLVERIWKWMPSYQSAAGSQSVGVEELVEGWNDCLETIKRKLG